MTALGAFSSGDVLTAADLNAIGTWTTFTPTGKVGANNVTFTSASGKYVVINELAIALVYVNGFSYSGSGSLSVGGLPAAAEIASVSGFGSPRIGFASLWNGAVSVGYEGTPYRLAASEVGFTGSGIGVWTNTSPFMLAANTELYFTIVYEVA